VLNSLFLFLLISIYDQTSTNALMHHFTCVLLMPLVSTLVVLISASATLDFLETVSIVQVRNDDLTFV